MLRRTLTAFVVSAMLAGVLYAGPTPEKGGATTAPAMAAAGSAPEPITLPIVKDRIVVKTFCTFEPIKGGAAMNSYADVPAYKKMLELTNIDMQFVHPPVGQQNEQFNLMVSSGQYPDIIEWNWLAYPGGPEKAIQDKVIIPMNDAIAKYAPNLTKILTETPTARRQVLTDTGLLYGFPFLRLSPKWHVIYGFQANSAWLKKLNIEPPNTLDDWYKMLVAFKTRDPNGNGNPNDEIPFISNGLPRLYPLTGAFGVSDRFYRIDNTVKFGPAEKEYLDWLTTMNKWYNEKLLDPDFASTSSNQFDAKVASGVGGAWHNALSGGLGRLIQLTRQKDPAFSITGLPFPVGPAGKPYDTELQRVMYFPGTSAAISTSSKYVKEITKYLDYGYGTEGHLLMVFGIEGESYTVKNGEPFFTDKVMKNPTLSVDQAIGQWSRGVSSPPLVFDDWLFRGRIFLPEQNAAHAVWSKGLTERIMPPVTPTPDEARRFSSLMGTLNTYIDEMTVKFITGKEPLANFDKYVAQLKALSVDEVVALRQKALERYNGRK
jgi:putative aldouronate transport system substrate-binding protein